MGSRGGRLHAHCFPSNDDGFFPLTPTPSLRLVAFKEEEHSVAVGPGDLSSRISNLSQALAFKPLPLSLLTTRIRLTFQV